MTISWETVLIALIQAAATIVTKWMERCDRRKNQPRKKSRSDSSHVK